MRTKITTGLVISALFTLSACVTQQYDADAKKMVVKNEASNQEIAMTRISLALGYLKMGNTTQAKLNLEKAKYYAPDMVAVHTTFAHYYEYVGEDDLAEQAYQKALSINPNDADTLNNYGVFLCRQGDIVQAKHNFLAAVAVPSYTHVSNSYKNLATCLLGRDEFHEARRYFEKAIQHSPSDADAIFDMMQLQYAIGNYEEAQLLMHRYEKVTRRFNPEAIALGYKIYQKLGKLDVAKNYAAMLLKMFPQSFAAKQYLLNGLAMIEADKLAKRYQQKQQALIAANRKPKRVVKLSPKKHQLIAANKAKPTKVLTAKPDVDENKPLKLAETDQTTAKASEPVALASNPNTNNQAKASAQVSLETEPKTDEAKAKQAVNQAKRVENAPTIDKNSTSNDVPVHIIKKGENLFSVSRQYNIRLSALLRWNKLTSKSRVYVGDKIYLANPAKKAVNIKENNHDG